MTNDNSPLSLSEARARLRRGERLSAADAFQLRKSGETVDEALIDYPADDDDDGGEAWRLLTPVDLTLHLPPEVAAWLAEQPAERLVSTLVEQRYALRKF